MKRLLILLVFLAVWASPVTAKSPSNEPICGENQTCYNWIESDSESYLICHGDIEIKTIAPNALFLTCNNAD